MPLGWDGKSELGSRADLGAQIDALNLPPSMTSIGEYRDDPPKKWWRRHRPSLVRWFDLEGSLEVAREQILSCLDNARVKYHVDTIRERSFLAPMGFT